jgi:hypothetical protein
VLKVEFPSSPLFYLCVRALVAVISFFIFKKNFMKNIKKPNTADTLYLDEGVGNDK